MNKYSLDEDIKPEENDLDNWANAPEPEDMEEFDNLRLDKDAMARYREVKKAREQNSRAKQGYHHKR